MAKAHLLLLTAVLIFLAIHQVEPAGGKGKKTAATQSDAPLAPKGNSRQKANKGNRTSESSSSSSKAMVKSDTLITDETLDSNYVRLIIDKMEEGSRKSLEQKIEGFLLSKKKSRAGSSEAGVVKAQENVADSQLQQMTKLHLAELKTLLVEYPLVKSELAKAFEKLKKNKDMLEAKARMRALLGKGMFLELEMRLPGLLRIELVERAEQLAFYEKVLSTPGGGFLENPYACRLHIPILFDMLTRMTTKEELVKFWMEKVLMALGNKEVGEEALYELAGQMHDYQVALTLRPSLNRGEMVALSPVHTAVRKSIAAKHTVAALALFREDQRLLNFIKSTRGALARFYAFFDRTVETDAIMISNVWTESELPDKLVFEYIRALTVDSVAERQKSLVSADILIQVLFLDNKFKGKKAIQDNWPKWRHTCLYIVDKLVEANEEYVTDYGTIYKYMLYKLRKQQQHSNMDDFIEFKSLLIAELTIIAKWKILDKEGKKRGGFLVPIEEGLEEAEWLDKQHREMLDRLKLENEKFKKELDAVDSTLIDAMLSTHSQLVTQQEQNSEVQAEVIYHECPKDRGYFSYNRDAQFYAYAEYLLTTKDEELPKWENQVKLNALMSAYIVVIDNLLQNNPVENPDKLREEWTQERADMISALNEAESKGMGIEVTAPPAICKLHAFLLHRLIKAKLGPDVDDAVHKEWKLRLRETYISQTLMELLDKDENYGKLDANCEPEVAQRVTTELFEHISMQWPTFYYLDQLIGQNDLLRRIICQVASKDDIELLGAKTRMFWLMGVYNLGNLEIIHPMILEIDDMLPAMRYYYYDIYLEHNRYDPEEKGELAEMRIALSLLVGLVRKIEAEAKNEDKTAVEKRVKWLLQEVFRNYDEFVSSRNICLLSRFIEHSEAMMKGKRIAGTDETKVDAYSKKREIAECDFIEEQTKQMEWQRKKLAENHRDFLRMFPEQTAIVLGKPGRKTAMVRLLELKHLELVWNVDDYTDDSQLSDYFVIALFLDDKFLSGRLSARFGINFASWHRWIAAELHKDKGPRFELFAQLWAKEQRQMLARLDILFDVHIDMDFLMRAKAYWPKMQAGLKDLLLRLPKMDENHYRSGISTTFTNIFLGKDPEWNARWSYEQWTKFNEWIQQKNRVLLIDLMQSGWKDEPEKREKFKQNLLEGFRQFPVAKGRLIHLIGNDVETLSLINKELGIEIEWHDFSMEIDYMAADEHKSSKVENPTVASTSGNKELVDEQSALGTSEAESGSKVPMNLDSPNSKSDAYSPTETRKADLTGLESNSPIAKSKIEKRLKKVDQKAVEKTKMPELETPVPQKIIAAKSKDKSDEHDEHGTSAEEKIQSRRPPAPFGSKASKSLTSEGGESRKTDEKKDTSFGSKSEKKSESAQSSNKQDLHAKTEIKNTYGVPHLLKLKSKKESAAMPRHQRLTTAASRSSNISSMDRMGVNKKSAVESVLDSMVNKAENRGYEKAVSSDVVGLVAPESEVSDQQHEQEREDHEIAGLEAEKVQLKTDVSAPSRVAEESEDLESAEWITPKKKDKRPKYIKSMEASLEAKKQHESMKREKDKASHIYSPRTGTTVPKPLKAVASSPSRVEAKLPEAIELAAKTYSRASSNLTKTSEPQSSISPKSDTKMPKTLETVASSPSRVETKVPKVMEQAVSITQRAEANQITLPAGSSSMKKTTSTRAIESPKANIESGVDQQEGITSEKGIKVPKVHVPKSENKQQAEISAEKILEQVMADNEKLEEEKLKEMRAKTGKSINVEEAIVQVKKTIQQWDKEAFLLVTGSYQLGLYTAGSDIDCLFMLPHGEDQDWEELYKEHFLGEPRKEKTKKKVDKQNEVTEKERDEFASEMSDKGLMSSSSASEDQPSSSSAAHSSASDVPVSTPGLNPSALEFSPSTDPSPLGYRHHDSSAGTSHGYQAPPGYQPPYGGNPQPFAGQPPPPPGQHFTSPANMFIRPTSLPTIYQQPSVHPTHPQMHQPHPQMHQPHPQMHQPHPQMHQPHPPMHQQHPQMHQPPPPMHQPPPLSGTLMVPDFPGPGPSLFGSPQNPMAIGYPLAVKVHIPQSHSIHPIRAASPPTGTGVYQVADPRDEHGRRTRRSPHGSADAAGPSGFAEYNRDGKGKAIEMEAIEEIRCEMGKARICANESLYCMLCKNEAVTSFTRIPGQIPLIKMKFHGFDFKLIFVTFPRTALNIVEKISKGKETEEGGGKGRTSGKELAYGEVKILGRERDEKDGEEKGKEHEIEIGMNEVGNKGSAVARLQNVESVDQVINAFVDAVGAFELTKYESKIQKGMLLALSDYRANLRLLELLDPHSKHTFRLAMLTLKLWAKWHFVAGDQFGLHNGTTMTLMFVHIFLQHPKATVPSLLVQFFDTYSRWIWPTPVEFEPSAAIDNGWNQKRDQHLLDWSEENEIADRENQLNLTGYKKLVWPVLTPGLPRQNAAVNVNPWTAQIIQREFEQSHEELQNLEVKIHENDSQMQQTDEQSIKEKWEHWLGKGIKFERKYKHFLAIVCAFDEHLQHGSDYCDFVESQIRLQLLAAFGDVPQVEFMHVNPETVWHNKTCPQQMQQASKIESSSSTHQPQQYDQQTMIEEGDLCTIWLVGIQMQSNLQFGSIPATLSPEFIAKIFGEVNHLHKFVEPIQESFNKEQEAAGRKMMAQKLTVKYYPRDELEISLA